MRNRIPDPLTVLLILISRLVIPDPVAVIPDPIYLVTTLILARQVQKSAARINSDRIKNKKKNKSGLGSTRIIKRKIKSVGVTYLSPAILFFSHELVVA